MKCLRCVAWAAFVLSNRLVICSHGATDHDCITVLGVVLAAEISGAPARHTPGTSGEPP